MASDNNKFTATLYLEHKTSLLRYVLRRLPQADASHAEDVVQETFTHTIRHLENGKTVDSPKAFLFTTAHNLIVSAFYRSRQHRTTDPTSDMDEFATAANASSPEQKAMAHQQLDALCVAIASIPRRYQEAFVRRRVWGESCREIAATMGLSERAVANYAALGWQLMRDYCETHRISLSGFADHD